MNKENDKFGGYFLIDIDRLSEPAAVRHDVTTRLRSDDTEV